METHPVASPAAMSPMEFFQSRIDLRRSDHANVRISPGNSVYISGGLPVPSSTKTRPRTSPYTSLLLSGEKYMALISAGDDCTTICGTSENAAAIQMQG